MIKFTKEDCLDYIKKIEPTWEGDWFHLEAIDLLCRMMNGDPLVQNLLVAWMPGLGKTQLFSILFPSYVLSKIPTSHILLLGNNDNLAAVTSAQLLRIVKTPEFRQLQPLAKLKESERDITFESGDGRPNVHAASITGNVLGYRADYICGDDLISSFIQSDDVTAKVWLSWQSAAETRALPNAKQVIIGQRIGVNDIHARVLERAKDKEANQFCYFKLAAVSDGTQSYVQFCDGSIKYFPAYNTPVKKPSQPYSFTSSKLKKKLASMPHSMMSAMYLQAPQETAELPFRTSQWPVLTELSTDDIVQVFSSWDLSFGKTAVTNDWNANVVIGKTKWNSYLVLDAWRERLEFPVLLQVVVARWEALLQVYKIKPLCVVEDKGNGSALLQTLAASYPGIPTLAAKASRESKYQRSLVVQPYTTGGLVALYANMPGLKMFCNELDGFPQEGTGFWDDLADSFCHGMRAFIGPDGFKKLEEGIGATITKKDDLYEELIDHMYREQAQGPSEGFSDNPFGEDSVWGNGDW